MPISYFDLPVNLYLSLRFTLHFGKWKQEGSGVRSDAVSFITAPVGYAPTAPHCILMDAVLPTRRTVWDLTAGCPPAGRIKTYSHSISICWMNKRLIAHERIKLKIYEAEKASIQKTRLLVTSMSSTWRWWVPLVPWSRVRASSKCAFNCRLSL